MPRINTIPAGPNVRIEHIEGARGFPHYVALAQFSESAQEWKRRIIAQCENKPDADAVIHWIKEGLRRAEEQQKVEEAKERLSELEAEADDPDSLEDQHPTITGV